MSASQAVAGILALALAVYLLVGLIDPVLGL